MRHALPTTPQAQTAIEAVVFDFGGVFTESPSALATAAAVAAGIDPGEFLAMMLGSYGIDSQHPWHRVERGELPLAPAIAWAKAESKYRFGVEMDPMQVMAPLLTAAPRPAMLDLARDLRNAGVATALLTNNAKEMGSAWRSLAPWEELLDVIVDSSEIGMRKPSPDAFHYALETLGVEPAAALMIDDFEVNVNGARQVGMRAVLCGDDPAAAIREVRELALDPRATVVAESALPLEICAAR